MKSKKLLFLENINFSLTLFNEVFSYVYNAAFTSASKKKQFVKLQYLYEVRAASANMVQSTNAIRLLLKLDSGIKIL